MAEILAVIALLLVFSQNLGFGYQITVWVNQLIKPAVKELDITGINSSYAVLMQAGSGRVVGDINGETPMYPASMTKIMTTIVAIENLSDLNQEITVTNDMIANLYAQDATQAGFQPGETVQAIDLLYGVMLPSGADCCIALADTIAGSEEGFVELMNQKAENWGLKIHISVIQQVFMQMIITVRQKTSQSFCAMHLRTVLFVRSSKVRIILHLERMYIRMGLPFTVQCSRICQMQL